jgi:hypothetical protein
MNVQRTYTHNIYNSSTRSRPSEKENRTRNRSENCKCKQALRIVQQTVLRSNLVTKLLFQNWFRGLGKEYC